MMIRLGKFGPRTSHAFFAVLGKHNFMSCERQPPRHEMPDHSVILDNQYFHLDPFMACARSCTLLLGPAYYAQIDAAATPGVVASLLVTPSIS